MKASSGTCSLDSSLSKSSSLGVGCATILGSNFIQTIVPNSLLQITYLNFLHYAFILEELLNLIFQNVKTINLKKGICLSF